VQFVEEDHDADHAGADVIDYCGQRHGSHRLERVVL
jgi:hypothetical protein